MIMKAKVIIYGWILSWILLFSGIGTLESSEFGSFKCAIGFMLCSVWVFFSFALLLNEDECNEAGKEIEKSIDRIVYGILNRL